MKRDTYGCLVPPLTAVCCSSTSTAGHPCVLPRRHHGWHESAGHGWTWGLSTMPPQRLGNRAEWGA